MTKLLFLLIASAMAAPAVAQTASTAEPAASDSKKSDVDKLVCQRQDEIGSRLAAKKVCMTVKEWQEFRAQNRETVERWQQGVRAPVSN